MKFLDLEKSNYIYHGNSKKACHSFAQHKNFSICFPVKFTQYSEEDVKKWIDFCFSLNFKFYYKGIEKAHFGESYFLDIKKEDYSSTREVLAALTAIRCIQYEYTKNLTKIPEMTFELLDLGCTPIEALYFAHMKYKPCNGHSLVNGYPTYKKPKTMKDFFKTFSKNTSVTNFLDYQDKKINFNFPNNKKDFPSFLEKVRNA